MKKVFTLTLTLFILSSAAFSQSLFAHVSFNTPNISVSFNKGYVARDVYYSGYDRDMQIRQINQAYNEQVNEIMNLHISTKRKVDLIQQLQKERNERIQNVTERFSNNRGDNIDYNRYYNHDNKDWHDQDDRDWKR
jgi:hypothetical protein